jgi:LmbE family N-acetylglucosaminyl deacetylase
MDLFLGFDDGFLGSDMHGLVAAIDQVILDCQPEELYIPYPSTHQDHIALYEAGVRGGRLSMSPRHWFTPCLYVYDVAAYDINLYPSDLRWNIFEALSEEQIDKKIAAVEVYSSQAMVGPHPANGMKELAQAHGNARKLDWAEPFALVREVRR